MRAPSVEGEDQERDSPPGRHTPRAAAGAQSRTSSSSGKTVVADIDREAAEAAIAVDPALPVDRRARDVQVLVALGDPGEERASSSAARRWRRWVAPQHGAPFRGPSRSAPPASASLLRQARILPLDRGPDCAVEAPSSKCWKASPKASPGCRRSVPPPSWRCRSLPPNQSRSANPAPAPGSSRLAARISVPSRESMPRSPEIFASTSARNWRSSGAAAISSQVVVDAVVHRERDVLLRPKARDACSDDASRMHLVAALRRHPPPDPR